MTWWVKVLVEYEVSVSDGGGCAVSMGRVQQGVGTLLQQIDTVAEKHASLVIAGGVGLALTGGAWLGLAWMGLNLLPFGNVLLSSSLLIVGLFAVFTGFRSGSSPRYPTPEETFPSLSLIEFKAVLYAGDRPLCVCTDCLIFVPAQFSTGACPRCVSSVRYYEINTDEDVEMVLLDLPGAPSESLNA